MMFYQRGSSRDKLSAYEMKEGLYQALQRLGAKKKVLLIPPDFTRLHSRAGDLTALAYSYYKNAVTDILPALGTHRPMTGAEISAMFPGVPAGLFRVHDWRNRLSTLGRIPADYIAAISEGAVQYDWPAQVSSLITEGDYDLILSIGQVVPHEVAGMANYNKNLFVGTGGAEGINKSHFLGAAYGMERIMGRAVNPVRQVLNRASDQFLRPFPIVYVQTVIGRDASGGLALRGLFIGDDEECYRLAADLSLQVNFTMLEKPLQKVVVYLDPGEYKSTWLGNKSIYRTRMAIADGGELLILAPGLREFGEDAQIDQLIRQYGYAGTPAILALLEQETALQQNLSAAAHLIHGSSEGRFSVTYCPGHLGRAEIESVHFKHGDLHTMLQRYHPDHLQEGYNTLADGEEIYFIHNPAIGLWAYQQRFISSQV